MTTQRANILLGLLVVGLTITLNIPIVRNMRAAQARTETRGRLKGMGLSLQGFEGDHKRMPPAFDSADTRSRPGKTPPLSVHVHLLPYLGEEMLYLDFINGKKGADTATVASFLAAGDPTIAGSVGVQSFAANLRLFTASGWPLQADEDLPSLKGIEPGTNMSIARACYRGSSNIVAFATKHALCGDGGSHFIANPTSPNAAYFGQNHAEEYADPRDLKATFQLAPRGKDCCTSPLMAQSFDQKGLLVGFADGSTRFVAASLDPSIWNVALSPVD